MQASSAGAPAYEEKEKIVLRFVDGIYGFEDVKDFILLETGGKVIWSLRAADSDFPSLTVVDPFVVMRDYHPVLTDAERESLGGPADGELCFLAVAVIRKKLEESAVNLKSPIVINTRTKQARQIILENSDYPVRYRLFGGTPKRR